MQKHEYQEKHFEEAIKNKAVEYLHSIVEDSDRNHAYYDEIYEIAQLAKKVLKSKDDTEAKD